MFRWGRTGRKLGKATDLFMVLLDFLLKSGKNQLENLCFVPIKFSELPT